MWTADSLEKNLMLGKIEGRKRRGCQRRRWLDGITDAMDVNLGNSRRWWGSGRTGVLPSSRSQHMTGQQNNNNMWDLSSLTSIKPTPSALEDAILTTGLPGKSQLSQILELTSESNFSGSTESINELSLTVLVIQRKIFNLSTFSHYKDSGKVISKAERLRFLCQAVYLVDYTVHMVKITLELFFFPITWLHENYILKLKQKKSFQKV